MRTHDLLRLVYDLPDGQPVHQELERCLNIGPGIGRAWYTSQKEHWVRWLTEYPTEGPYGRKQKRVTSAKTVYNRLMCPPMVLWLPEAAGVDDGIIRTAFLACLEARPSCASQCAAIRSEVPWNLIEVALRGPCSDDKLRSET